MMDASLMVSGDIASRLLPPSIPYRYFATGALFQIVMWALLLVGAGDVAGFQGGPGPLLGAIHSLTLGVLAMTAVGASLQLLPVATLQPFGSLLLCKAVWWLLSAGTALLIYGMVSADPTLLAPGAWMTALALLLYASQIAVNLARASNKTAAMGLVVWHGILALLALAALAAFGVMLALDMAGGAGLDDYAAVVGAHLVLACYGFMGLLALGFSSFLIPMFALAPAPSLRGGYIVLGLMTGGILLATGGLLAGPGWLLVAGSALGLCGGIGYVWLMEDVVRQRMRRRLDRYFILIRSGWALLPLSLALALLWSAGAADIIPAAALPERLLALFGVLLLVGWLLSFMLGVLHRIVPFLASMHLMIPGSTPPLLSALTPGLLQRAHIALHLAALALLLAGIGADSTAIIRLGAVSGLAAALAFAAIIAIVLRRVIKAQEATKKRVE